MTKDELKPIDVSKYKVTETGQVLKMTKDEMKNRISFALKDPILQQGFEIICKDLAISEHDREHNDYELTEVYKKVEQLEKENAELERKLEQTEKDLADYQFNYPTIKELQEENAELKEEIKNNEDLATVAYMQGAERYKPKWHKVADGDLPPSEKGNYTINVLTDCGDIAYYDYKEDCWIVEPSSAEIDPPIAWCEIPKYSEEL